MSELIQAETQFPQAPKGPCANPNCGCGPNCQCGETCVCTHDANCVE